MFVTITFFKYELLMLLSRFARQNRMREAREDLIRTGLMQRFGDLADRSAGVAHVIDYQTILSLDVTDDVHDVGLIRPLATFVTQCETGSETLRICPCTLGTASIRCDDDKIVDRVRVEIVDDDRCGV